MGNRSQGDRLGALVPLAAVKLAAGLMFAAPAMPLLFMGEEYGETSPFQFFTSFLDRDLAEAVRRGRTEEFRRFAWQGEVPDPGEPATYLRSRLNHTLGGAPRHRELREYYRHWLTLRRRHPALGARGKEHAPCELDAKGAVLTLTRGPENGPRVRVVANLTPTAIPLEKQPEGWLVLLDSDDTQFAGTGTRSAAGQPFQLLLYEARG